jgi:DNA-directed RNA polymerase specialized sigma24 family protein
LVLAAASEDLRIRDRAFDALAAVYWKPVYKYIRVKWPTSIEDAKDLTQAFFAAAFEKNFFEAYDPGKAKFQTFLRICVDRLVANARKADGRIKRGGQAEILSLDFESAEGELQHTPMPHGVSPEHYFYCEWVRSLFAQAVDDLRAQCQASGKALHFALFERYDLDPPVEGRPSYAQLAHQFKLPETQVTNFLAFARSEFRRHLLERLRQITGSDEEFRAEGRRLLGIEPL